MADQDQNHSAQQDSNAPSFNLQRTYVKDASLELPNAPQIFLEQSGPSVEVSVNVGGQRLAETVYESTVTATITTRIDDKVLYLAEVQQAGIFEAANIPEEQLDPLLGIVCPTMLYPYLRANIADLISRSSLPPLHLPKSTSRLCTNSAWRNSRSSKARTAIRASCCPPASPASKPA